MWWRNLLHMEHKTQSEETLTRARDSRVEMRGMGPARWRGGTFWAGGMARIKAKAKRHSRAVRRGCCPCGL